MFFVYKISLLKLPGVKFERSNFRRNTGTRTRVRLSLLFPVRTPLLPIKIYSSYCFCVGSCVAVAWVRGDTLCTIPNPSHEKLRKQSTLFLFFYGVPLPPSQGDKRSRAKALDLGTGKDIIVYSRAEPSGLHPCHR